MEWDVFVDAFPYVMEGFKLTVILTIVCYIFALIVGFVWVFLRRIPIRFISWLITWIMEFIRSTPPLVQLFFLYYGLTVLPGVGVSLSAFTCAVIGLGLHFSTYIGEVYRSGIESVDQGQWEASTALHLSTWQKWTKVILPQAIPPTIPMLGNYFIILFTEVPLASTVGVIEILAKAESYGAKHFKYLEALTIVALIFLVLSYPSSLFFNYLEKRTSRRFNNKATSSSS